jgi:hypothetical protein
MVASISSLFGRVCNGDVLQTRKLLELMAKSRHRKPENLRRYFKPSPQAMRELTSLIGPGADRRG